MVLQEWTLFGKQMKHVASEHFANYRVDYRAVLVFRGLMVQKNAVSISTTLNMLVPKIT